VQTELALVLLVFVVAVVLLAIGLCLAVVRRVGRARRAIRQLTGRIEDGQPSLGQRLADERVRMAAAVEASVALREHLDQVDATMAVTAQHLRDGRGSIDEAIRERLVPLARWFARVVAISRLWRMQREMWRG
jgi:hypothetical protein